MPSSFSAGLERSRNFRLRSQGLAGYKWVLIIWSSRPSPPARAPTSIKQAPLISLEQRFPMLLPEHGIPFIFIVLRKNGEPSSFVLPRCLLQPSPVHAQYAAPFSSHHERVVLLLLFYASIPAPSPHFELHRSWPREIPSPRSLLRLVPYPGSEPVIPFSGGDEELLLRGFRGREEFRGSKRRRFRLTSSRRGIGLSSLREFICSCCLRR